MEIKLNEVDVQKLNLQPGEVLVVKIRSDEISQYDVQRLSEGLKSFFTNNKVIILAVGANDSIDLTVAKESEYTPIERETEESCCRGCSNCTNKGGC